MFTFYDRFGINAGRYARVHLRFNDYWSKDDRIEGIWFGKMCEEVGVVAGAKVSEKEFRRLSENIHAKTKERITVKHNTTRTEESIDKETGKLKKTEVSNRKAFCDGPCSAPKTFSVQAILGSDERILEWHRIAVQKAVKEMEMLSGKYAHNGKDYMERTGNIVAAMYTHTNSRCQEVQLHTHVVTFNMTKAENGKRYAVYFREFYDQSKFLSAVYRDELAKEAIAAGVKLSLGKYVHYRLTREAPGVDFHPDDPLVRCRRR